MSFILPDIVLEDVIRGGLAPFISDARTTSDNPDTIDSNGFVQLVDPTITAIIGSTIFAGFDGIIPAGATLVDGTIAATNGIQLDFSGTSETGSLPEGSLPSEEVLDLILAGNSPTVVVYQIEEGEPTALPGSEIARFDFLSYVSDTEETELEILLEDRGIPFNTIFPNNGVNVEIHIFNEDIIIVPETRRLDVVFGFGETLPDGGGNRFSSKYNAEALKISDFLVKNNIAIVHSFSEVQTRMPCISIQLKNDIDDRRENPTSDFGGFSIDDFDENIALSNVQVSIGIHTKEALMTKYLYIILKYIVLSRRIELERRGFIASTFGGSDFNRDMAYKGDIVYSRFLTMIGKTEDTWIDIDEDPIAFPDVTVAEDGTIERPEFINIVLGAENTPSTNDAASGDPVQTDPDDQFTDPDNFDDGDPTVI